MSEEYLEDIDDDELILDEEPEDDEQQEKLDREKWVKLARDAHEQSESFLEAGVIHQWRRNYALAQSQHPDGSKYHTETYRHRSKNFRGKTEASIRKNEAAMAVAMFSNRDVVSITPENPDDEYQVNGAKAIHRLANYRLDSSKWFMTSLGAYHECQITGNIVSEQYWDYEETESGEVVKDNPEIILYPPENVKISPHAHWLDPINTSPYVVIEVPMFIGDVKARMQDDWIEYADNEIKTATATFKYDSVRSAREGDNQTAAKSAAESSVTDFDLVYVHKNFIRHEGEELFYYTLATNLLLSEPVPLQQQYPHLKRGERPLIMGTASVDPHKVYSRSLTDRVSGTQIQSNEISNQRNDNVKLVLNKRKYVKRNMNVDYAALRRSIPGASVLMDDINAVKTEDMPDVTASSYQEQHLINADFDELAGTFSNGSVMTNRALNDSVGGMQIMKGDSNVLTEYQLRVMVETWVEPVVRQIVRMIKFYEDDKVIQAVTNEQLTNQDLQVPIETRVSVGFGSTDPQTKMQKLLMALNVVKDLPGVPQRLKGVPVAREVFGSLGYNDAKAFLGSDEEQEDPRIQQLMQQVQELQSVIETKQVETQGKLQVEQYKGQFDLARAAITERGNERIKMVELALNRNLKIKDIENRTGIDTGRLNLDILKELNRRMEIANQQRELNSKISGQIEEGI